MLTLTLTHIRTALHAAFAPRLRRLDVRRHSQLRRPDAVARGRPRRARARHARRDLRRRRERDGGADGRVDVEPHAGIRGRGRRGAAGRPGDEGGADGQGGASGEYGCVCESGAGAAEGCAGGEREAGWWPRRAGGGVGEDVKTRMLLPVCLLLGRMNVRLRFEGENPALTSRVEPRL